VVSGAPPPGPGGPVGRRGPVDCVGLSRRWVGSGVAV